ncbi:hypothetical protein DY000_02056136 [Brassica cretica]|uniref:Uncharacterized protein n=1 Tax=Brassica cretica TaxID=69181 RepID=A0ABQ7A4A8_BRACR|nr:hypothetical protein DY000_02056136 [Brassica cretica]
MNDDDDDVEQETELENSMYSQDNKVFHYIVLIFHPLKGFPDLRLTLKDFSEHSRKTSRQVL